MFIIVNMASMPLWGLPTSQPVEPSKFSWHVAEALSPILCSIAATDTPFEGPGVPSSLGRYLGTRNRLMPFTPSGASGRRARTRCTMFSVRSCSPAEMKILLPLTR